MVLEGCYIIGHVLVSQIKCSESMMDIRKYFSQSKASTSDVDIVTQTTDDGNSDTETQPETTDWLSPSSQKAEAICK